MYKSQYDNHDCGRIGEQAHLKFVRLASRRGWITQRSTSEQDIKGHWDVRITDNGHSFRVDVKAMKRIKRSGEIQSKWVWVEIRNVTGKLGWMYSPETDLLAFEYADGFRLVLREHLVSLVESSVEKVVVRRPEDAEYRIYRRQGRKDMITRILMDDIEQITATTWREKEVQKTNGKSRRTKTVVMGRI